MRILLRQRAIHLLRRDMFHFEEHAQDLLALTGQLELMFREVILEDLYLFLIFVYHDLGLAIENEY